jgi:CO/xanthine dehydrogenase Mo-binding subunit
MTIIGQSVLRLEDPPLLTGRGRFVADLSFPHQLHMRVVRSAHAHGRIRMADTAAALAAPGVVAVWTHPHVAELPPIGLREGLGTQQPTLPDSHPICSRFSRVNWSAMSASRSRQSLRKIPIWPKTQPISSRSKSRNCRPH